MVLPDVVKAGWGRDILNTIILNHKENGGKLSGCADEPPSASPGRIAPARRSVRCISPSLSHGDFTPKPPTAERGGAVFGACCLWVSMWVSMRIGQEPPRLFRACWRGFWFAYKTS